MEGLYVDVGFGLSPYAILSGFEGVTQSATRSLTITIPVDPYAVSLPVVITLDSRKGKVISGTFEGTLIPQDDDQPTLQVTGGQYRVTLKKAAGT